MYNLCTNDEILICFIAVLLILFVLCQATYKANCEFMTHNNPNVIAIIFLLEI